MQVFKNENKDLDFQTRFISHKAYQLWIFYLKLCNVIVFFLQQSHSLSMGSVFWIMSLITLIDLRWPFYILFPQLTFCIFAKCLGRNRELPVAVKSIKTAGLFRDLQQASYQTGWLKIRIAGKPISLNYVQEVQALLFKVLSWLLNFYKMKTQVHLWALWKNVNHKHSSNVMPKLNLIIK